MAVVDASQMCGNCDFFRSKNGQGTCRINAPTVHILIVNEVIGIPGIIGGEPRMAQAMKVMGAFPPVGPDDWCAKFYSTDQNN